MKASENVQTGLAVATIVSFIISGVAVAGIMMTESGSERNKKFRKTANISLPVFLVSLVSFSASTAK